MSSFSFSIPRDAVSPLAAAMAIVPVYKELADKTTQQLSNIVPKTLPEALKESFRQLREPMPMSFSKRLIEGLKLSPTVGIIVGSQLFLEKKVAEVVPSKLGSATIVGLISSPFLAVFNGQAAGQGVWKPFRNLFTFQGIKQAAMIVGQETSFVYAIAASDPVCEWAKQTLGDNAVVDYAAAFFNGGAGSVVGHGFNTALTRWQNGKPVALNYSLANGAFRKARGIGIFAMGLKFWKQELAHKENV